MRQGTIAGGKNFPIKVGDQLVFVDRAGRPTSFHRVTHYHEKAGLGVTEIRDVSRETNKGAPTEHVIMRMRGGAWTADEKDLMGGRR